MEWKMEETMRTEPFVYSLRAVSALLTLSILVLCASNAYGAYRPIYDFSGDGRTDFTVLSMPAGNGNPITWKFLRNPGVAGPGNAFIRSFVFGRTGDTITAADFTGDSKTDISIYRSGENLFYTTAFPEITVSPVIYLNWGASGDAVGRDGDYDGDGKDDETLIRLAFDSLQWWIKGSGGTDRVTTFGVATGGYSTFAFQGADFTGDGRDELIFARSSNTTGAVTWFVGDSITGEQILQTDWGNFNTDFLLNPDDYSGDGRADLPVWRAGGTGAGARYWYILNTATGTPLPLVLFGIGDPNFINNDLPIRGNYDGDQKADIAVFRPSTREWFWINSSDGSLGIQQWGDVGDRPLPGFFTF